MPAIPSRRRAKPFAPQSALKHPRTFAKLRRYAKRRASYNASAALVLCMFMLRYLPELREWRAERRRIAARHGNMLRQRRFRKRKKYLLRIARLTARHAKLAAQIAVLMERIRVREYHQRRNAKEHQGTVDGFGAAIPMDAAQLKALHFSLRYRIAYCEAVAQKAHWTAVMQKQSTPVVQPRTIQL
jgi:hypothetical protein